MPPAVPLKTEPAFAVASSAHADGSIWMEVSNPRPMVDGTRVAMTFDVYGDPGTSATFVLGGAFPSADPRCNGSAFDLAKEMIGEADDLWLTLSAYAQRRPGTGHLFDASWRAPTPEEDANEWLATQPLLIDRDVVLTGTVEKQFVGNAGTEPKQLELATARLTCTFDESALESRALYRHAYRAPDLVVAQSDRGGDGILRVSYTLEMRSVSTVITNRGTVEETAKKVDNGAIVTQYAADWWSSGGDGAAAILQTGGLVVTEPQSASGWRSWSRLAGGVFATLALAVATTAIASRVNKANWAAK